MGMVNYTLYHWEGGRIAEITEISCGDDASAMRLAHELYDGRAMVLWRGDRSLCSWTRQERAIRSLDAPV